MYPYTISDKTLTAYVEGKPYMTDRSNPNWSTIKDLLNDPATPADKIINAIKPIGAVAAALQGVVNVEVAGGSVLVDGQAIGGVLAKRVLDIQAEGLNLDPWVAFVQNIWANPFKEAREELYLWLERAEMPITSDGCFLALKVVNSEFLDRHSRTFRNRVGDVVSMPREDCDNSSRALCSKGLHFCSKSYLPSFGVHGGDHVMLVKINPADVVSIPRHETDKGRTWRYEVIAEIDAALAGVKNWASVDDSWDTPDEVTTADAPIVIKSAYGDITPDGLVMAKDQNGGTWAGVARAIGAPPGTVSTWVSTFRKKGVTI